MGYQRTFPLDHAFGLNQTRQITQTKGYIYGISDGEFVKLGYSAEPEKRLRSLQIGNARALDLVFTIAVSNVVLAETNLHFACRQWHERAEWYDIICLSYLSRNWYKLIPRSVDGNLGDMLYQLQAEVINSLSL